MIQSVEIKNFKCLKDFQIDLGKFNVLIGPNDSGKTAFLHALLVISVTGMQGRLLLKDTASKAGIELGEFVWNGAKTGSVFLTVRGIPQASLSIPAASGTVTLPRPDHANPPSFASNLLSEDGKFLKLDDRAPDGSEWTRYWFSKVVGKASYYRFSPSALRADSPMIGNLQMSVMGQGLPTFLEEFLRSDRRGFFAMEEDFSERFPEYGIQIEKVGGNNSLKFKARSGQLLGAGDVSDGVLFYLAFLAITHQPNSPQILLIEEPENGVHHARLEQIVRALKDVAKRKGVQVCLTTHSPYLVDLVEPEDVRVFQKDPKDGSVTARPLTSFKDVDEMKKHFMSGEIWTMLSEKEGV